MLTITSFESTRKVLCSKDEFGPPSMLEYIELLEKEANIDFYQLKRYLKSLLPFMYGDEHLNIRKLVNRYFSVSAVRKWHFKIIGIIESRLAMIEPDRSYDFIKDVADPLYMDFVEELFGIDLPDREKFISQVSIATKSVERMVSISLLVKLQDTLVDLDKLLSEKKEDGLFSEITNNVDGKLGIDETSSVLLALLIGARVTTETIAHIVLSYSQIEQEERKKYTSHGWVTEHINDLVRLNASTNILSKEAKRDLVIDGCPIAKGQQVLIDIPSVNRDPCHYGEQVSLDAIGGEANKTKHLTFGGGAHICIGAELARDIIREFIPRLFGRFSSVSCDEKNISYCDDKIANRIKTFPVVFN
ncbi:cytochrome P450 [Shewanella waksmanii]|uniref:cytochrome P450 n=1 Tax=Shewanella waksmanii TaxID=213783 RepID=UPI0037351B77